MDRRRLAKTRFDQFVDSLRLRGFSSYEHYLASEDWRQFNLWYRTSNLPKFCLICRNKEFVLHHWNYINAGQESLGDVIPLCEQHHHELHVWLKRTKSNIRAIEHHLHACFDLPKIRAKQALRPFRQWLKKDRKSSKITRFCIVCGKVKVMGIRKKCPSCKRLNRRGLPLTT
jgi:nitrate/TMAO reductase-like tetraheme cytochrome c subunit